jgi:hypothetical protein
MATVGQLFLISELPLMAREATVDCNRPADGRFVT